MYTSHIELHKLAKIVFKLIFDIRIQETQVIL
jgi:hypothetical protein